jgi:O-antigen/teichoic acid export membrane protein
VSGERLGALVRDSGSYLLSKAAPGLAGLLTVIVFIRIIGREQYGKYTLAFSIMAVVSAFFTGWLNQALVRFRSGLHDAEAVKLVVLVGGAVSVALCWVALGALYAVGVLDPADYSLMGFGAVLMLCATHSFFHVRISLLLAEIRPQRIVVVSLVQAVGGIGLPVVLFVTLGRSYVVALSGLALAYAVAALWRVDGIRSLGAVVASGYQKWRRVRSLAVHFAGYGWALSFWFAATLALAFSDRFFIERYFGFAQVGSYGAVYDVIFRGYSLALAPVTLAVHPRIMRAWNARRPDTAWQLWRWGMIMQFGIFAVVALVLGLFPHVAAWAILPAGAPELVPLVLPLAVGGFLWQFALLAHKPLEMASRTGLMLVGAMGALAVNVAANYFLLPKYGVLVPAYTTIVTGAVYIAASLAIGTAVHRRVRRSDPEIMQA